MKDDGTLPHHWWFHLMVEMEYTAPGGAAMVYAEHVRSRQARRVSPCLEQTDVERARELAEKRRNRVEEHRRGRRR